jgi:hypothetical protein
MKRRIKALCYICMLLSNKRELEKCVDRMQIFSVNQILIYKVRPLESKDQYCHTKQIGLLSRIQQSLELLSSSSDTKYM